MMTPEMQALYDLIMQSEKRTLKENVEKQRLQFEKLIDYARNNVPFYKEFYKGVEIHNLPILTREDIRNAGDQSISQNIPEFHGDTYPMKTSGTTGKYVSVLATDFTRLFYDALMLREHAWHNRDFTKKLLSIRWEKRDFAPAPVGHYQHSWGAPINQYKQTGPGIFINVASSTPSQIEALLFYKPTYVCSYPSQLTALAEHCLVHNIKMPFLEEARMTGETLSETAIKTMKQAWPDIKITDVYSSVEMGFIAHQCSEFGNYHINIENVLLEIVDEQGKDCAKHQSGRILLTSLMNYATPLIRYEIGDYGTLGDECPCGRGMPVLKKIEGRKRNRLILPSGESRFPYLGDREDAIKITGGVSKFQIVQHSVTDLEFKIVMNNRLNNEQVAKFKKLYQTNLGYPFDIAITYHDDIPLGPTGKYEEFISMMSASKAEVVRI